MEEIIYFSVNNWFCGRDYPPTKNFKKWLGDDLNQTFRDDKWAKENKLCIYYGVIDMSQNYTIAAPRSWVEKNCPELLTDDEYTYVTCTYGKDGEKRFMQTLAAVDPDAHSYEDMFRTCLNITGDGAVTIVMDQEEKKYDSGVAGAEA